MVVSFRYPTVLARIDVAKLRKQSEIIVTAAGCKGWDLGVLLTGDKYIQGLNRKFRQKDEPTDILAFPFHDDIVAGQMPHASTPDEENLGELVISVPYVQRWCKERSVKLHNRLVRLVAHGVCHCLGHDHEEDADARLMMEKERFILEKLAAYESFMVSKPGKSKQARSLHTSPHVFAHLQLNVGSKR